ncbi:MAG: class I SAM-dependent methyltransferase [Candidatus Hodarchaeota archaeon]
MSINILKELNLEKMRGKFLKYTRKAFKMLPEIENPRILDIGCGAGIPTLELAKLSNGEIIGIDIDQKALNKLNSKIDKQGLSNRIKAKKLSLYNNSFSDEYFDILWDEGVLHILDLEKSLKECNRILKPKGFLVLGEMITWIKNQFEIFPKYGFNLVNQFFLPEKCWWTDYYLPLEKKIKDLYIKYKGFKDLKKLKQYEREIEMVKKKPKEFDCGFYIMQKVNQKK